MSRNLMQWQPFHEINHFLDDDFMGMVSSSIAPAIDVYQDKDNVIVETQLPGIDPKSVNVDVENDVLTISAHSEKKSETKKEHYYRKEIRSGSFERSVVLPMLVKGAKATATYEKGMLKVTLPKDDAAKPKKVAVKVIGK